jgi:hypothetical protein
LIWQRTYGGSGEDIPYSIQQTRDGGYVISGISFSTDIPGTENHGEGDIYILRIDADGDVLWQKMFGGSSWDWGGSSVYGFPVIQETSDNGFIVASSTTSSDITGVNNYGASDYYLFKLNADGDMVWQKAYGGTAEDYVYSISQTSDGGYIVIGESYSIDIADVHNHGETDCYILKLNSNGDL